jgi:hypothetical protein
MSTMNTQELLEMASLDAMGLLDPEEREAFERAFRAADPAVQAQIRREQLRYSKVDDLLPRVEAPLGLKARVLAAVRDAMQSMSNRRSDAAPALRFPTGVSQIWRVGAIGSMAAAIVLGYFTVQTLHENHGLTDARQGILISDQWQKDFGHRFEANFLNPNTQFVSFRPAPDARGARATLMIDPVKKSAQLLVKDLPAEGDYEVVVLDAHGNQSRAIITFKAPASGKKDEYIQRFDVEDATHLLIRLRGSDKAILKTNGV